MTLQSGTQTLRERKTNGDKGETTHLTRQICVADTSVCPVKRKLCASCYCELQDPLKTTTRNPIFCHHSEASYPSQPVEIVDGYWFFEATAGI